MRLLVTGGRSFSDRRRIEAELERLDLDHCIDVIIHGGATGADRLADQWARRRGVPVWPMPADWQRHGNAAGSIRNSQMLAEAMPTHFLAMPGGPGTADTVRKCSSAGIPPA